MEAYLHPLYLEDVQAVCDLPLPWEKLKGKTLVLSGATGLIGSCLVDVLMRRNISYGLDCRIVALGRSEERARRRFAASQADFSAFFRFFFRRSRWSSANSISSSSALALSR